MDAGFNVDLRAVQTNIIYARMPQAQACVDAWAARGVLASALGPDSVRFVLHHQVTDDGLEAAIRVLTAQSPEQESKPASTMSR